jgi:exopolysaccharide production protein ExoQ
MAGFAALILAAVFALWLFARDRKLRPMTSRALWIPLVWITILGTRSVSAWQVRDVDHDVAATVYLEGSPADRNTWLALIIIGIIILWKRRLDWGKIISSNRCLFAFLLYCGLSIVWSEYPFVSLKGFTKDLGNLVIILIIFTEKDPVLAIKALFARYTYIAIPLSLVLVTYFPDLGTHFTLSMEEIAYCGVTTNKNELGQILVVSGLFLVMDLFGKKPAGGPKTDKIDLLVRVALFAMIIWLLILAHSSTSVGCLAVGTFLLISMQFSPFKRQIEHLGMYSLTIVMLIVFINIPEVLQTLVGLLGRDMTFTGRTEIWENLLAEAVNPVLGTGYHSFWLEPGRMERYGFINQAHNGYLETYLNNGLVGAFLLVTMIVAVGAKIKKELLEDRSLGALFLTFLVVAVFVNLTEAMFDKLNLIWFTFLLAAIEYPLSASPRSEDAAEKVNPLIAKGRILRLQGRVLRLPGPVRYLNGK